MQELLSETNHNIEDIELIGLAAPGTISGGTIIKAGNLGIKDFAILNRLKELYNVPMSLRNDGKCAALAEKRFGAMKQYNDCIFINIGTGIGGAAFIKGELLEPRKYSGFEFGHMVLEKNGRQCTCGKKGCFETYGSISALKWQITDALGVSREISGKKLREELLVIDEPVIQEIVEEYLEYLKIGITNLIDIFEPEVVCFGGSFAHYADTPLYLKLMKKLNEPNATFNQSDMPKIVTAKFENNAGIIGAVANMK